MTKGPQPRAAFDRVVDKLTPEDGCLIFSGGRDPFNYGLVWNGERKSKVRAHRVVYEYYNGVIPKGMVIRHTCDNPPCCNIEHLVIGTQQENMRDMVERGRASSRPGENHPNSVLTDKDVLEIRRLREENGITYKELAEKFCVSQSLIAQVITRRSWKHL